jgi:hypothetical protein
VVGWVGKRVDNLTQEVPTAKKIADNLFKLTHFFVNFFGIEPISTPLAKSSQHQLY